jgi:hypothetical protein
MREENGSNIPTITLEKGVKNYTNLENLENYMLLYRRLEKCANT